MVEMAPEGAGIKLIDRALPDANHAGPDVRHAVYRRRMDAVDVNRMGMLPALINVMRIRSPSTQRMVGPLPDPR